MNELPVPGPPCFCSVITMHCGINRGQTKHIYNTNFVCLCKSSRKKWAMETIVLFGDVTTTAGTQKNRNVLRFYSPQNQTDVVKWDKLISRKHFKVTKNTKVCSNHFKLGYRCRASCPYPTLHMKGYKDQESEQNK